MVGERVWNSEIIFDMQHVRSFTLGDDELEAEVLSIFTSEMPGYLDVLRQVDLAGWADAAHKVKGAARGIGAWNLADLAADCEEMPTDDIYEPAQRLALVEKLALRFQQAKQEIERHLACG